MFVGLATLTPNGEDQRNDQEDNGENAPRKLAGITLGGSLGVVVLQFQCATGCLLPLSPASGGWRRRAFVGFTVRAVAAVHLGLRGRRVTGGFKILSYGLIFVKTYDSSVGAHESLVKNSSGELVELVLLQSLEHARGNLGGGRDEIERDFPLLAFALKFFAEGRQCSLAHEFYSVRWGLSGICWGGGRWSVVVGRWTFGGKRPPSALEAFAVGRSRQFSGGHRLRVASDRILHG